MTMPRVCLARKVKGRLNLEQHHGRTPAGVVARVMQCMLTLTTAI
ncbi:hypothetical protein [Streptomyces sp. NPDC048411]